MGIGERIREGAYKWNKRRQLRKDVRKSIYEDAKRGMSEARRDKKHREGWLDRAHAHEAKRAKRSVFWREDAGRLLGGLNADAQNLIGKPLRKRIAHIGKRRPRKHRKFKEPTLI